MKLRNLAVILSLVLLAGCEAILPRKLPKDPPPLVDMEEPLLYFKEPNDEAARKELPPGSFSGLEVGSARTSRGEEAVPAGVLVTKVVENSPADAAGLLPDDLVLSVSVAGGPKRKLSWPSEWRKIEIETKPGTKLTVVYDRAGLTRKTALVLIPRVHPRKRKKAARYRENERVGVVVRTATEVEARKGGLGPGGGAVIVGLSRRSPWREVGLRYGDLLVAIDGKPVDDPQVVLNAIRNGKGKLTIEYLRGGKKKTVKAPLTRREEEIRHLGIPPFVDYERDRDSTELSILLGLLRHRTTSAAWDWRFLWLFHLSGGDADKLEKVSE